MPPLLIPTARTPENYIRPNEVGINALEQAAASSFRGANARAALYDEAGRALKGVFVGAGDLLKQRQERQAQQEITGLGNELTDLQLRQIQEHGETGVYPSVEQDIEGIRNRLIDRGATEKTLRWFDQEANSIRLHTAKTQAAERAKNAGKTAVANLDKLINSSAAAAYRDPAALDHITSRASSTIRSGFSGFGEGQRAEADQKTFGVATEAAIKGFADRGQYDQARQLLADPKYAPAIGDKSAALTHYVDQREKAQQTQARSDQAYALRDQKQAVEGAIAGLTASMIEVGPDGKATGNIRVPQGFYSRAHDISQMPGVDKDDAASLKKLIKDAQEIEKGVSSGKGVETDPGTYQEMTRLMFNGLTARQVLEWKAARKLSDHDASMGLQAVEKAKAGDAGAALANRLFEKWAGSQKALIAKGSIYRPDARGEDRYGQFYIHKSREFQEGLAAGIAATDLLDAASPYYIGKDIKDYQIGPADARRGFRERAKGGLNPLPPVRSDQPRRNEGESPADYLKRLRGQ